MIGIASRPASYCLGQIYGKLNHCKDKYYWSVTICKDKYILSVTICKDRYYWYVTICDNTQVVGYQNTIDLEPASKSSLLD